MEGYEKKYELKLKSGTLKVNKGDFTGGIHELELFLSEISEIKKGDRLDILKRSAYRTLARALIKTKEYDHARGVIDKWLEFDENDIYGQFEYARLMTLSPDEKNKGKQLVLDLAKRFPGGFVLKSYVDLNKDSKSDLHNVMTLLAKPEPTASGLADAYIHYLNQRDQMLLYWELQCFKVIEDIHKKRHCMFITPEWTSNNEISFSADLPAGTNFIQVHPPTENIFLKPKFVLKNNIKKTKLQLFGPKFESNIISIKNDIIIAGWRDNIQFKRIELVHKDTKGNISGYFSAFVFPVFFVHITDDEQMKEIENILRSMEMADTANRFRSDCEAWLKYTDNFLYTGKRT